jgi:hypothetical protein
MAEGNSIERMIRLLIGVEGAQDAARAVERVGQSADRTEAKANKLQKAYKGVAKTLDFVADASSMVVAAQIGVQQAFQALGISGSQRQLADYSRALLESRQQFAKYNESLVKTERRVLMLKDRFAFTRQEILGLQAAFDKGFSFQAPQRMVQVFDTLRDVVGENVDAMQRLQSSIQQIGQKVPIYQELFSYGVASRSEKISKSARNMSRALLAASAIAGDITLDELKEQLGVMAQLDVARGSTDDARRQAAEAQARTDQLNQNIRTLNELRVLWEDILMKVAEGLQPALKTINNLLQAGGERLENIVALGLKVGSIFAAIGAINFASSVGKLATSMTSGLGFLANMGGGKQGPMQGPTGLAGNLAGMFGGVGSIPTKPMYVVIVGDMTAGGRMSPILGGPGGGRAGKAGKMGRFGRLAGTVGRFALPALAMGTAAYFGTSAAQSTFAGGDDLANAGDWGARTRAVGGLAAGVGGGAAMGAAIGTFIMPGLGTGGGAVLGAGIGAVVSGLKMLSTQLETTSEAAKKANDAYGESLNKRKMFAANEAEYDLADFEMQRKQILDQIQAEEAKAAKLSNNLFGVEGLGWGGPDEKLLEDLNKQREMLNKKIRTASDEVKKIEEGQERQTQEISASDKALIGFVARYQLLNSFIQISNRRFDAAIGKLDAMTNLLSQFRGASPLGEGFDSDAAFDNAMAARQRQLETISAAQNLISQFQNTINSMDIDGVDSDGEWIETMRQAVQDIPNIGEVISDEIMQKVADVGSAAQLKDVMATVADEIATARIKSIASFEKIFDTGLQTFEGERNLTASAKDLVAARVGLADSLAAGVAASAEMRMDQVRAIQAEIGALNKQIEFTTKFREEANAMLLEGQRTNNQDMINEGLLGQQMAEEKLNQLVAERLSMMTEQANITKSIRDGYVDAIAAMSTGAGMFTQIIIDQNKNLGQLQAGTNNRVVSLRSGAMARGLETSERYTPFGIMSDDRRFGASDEVNKLITESNPLAQFFSDADVGDEMISTISESGAAVVEIWQQEAGRFFSTASSALQNQRYGPSELQDMITNRGGQPATIGNPEINLNAQGRADGGLVTAASTLPSNVNVNGDPRDRQLAVLQEGEAVLSKQTVAQNGGPGFVDALNSGRITLESMRSARDTANRRRLADQLDTFDFTGSQDLKNRFIQDYPSLWQEKLYMDNSFYDLYSKASGPMDEGRYATADEYEGINEHHMKILRRLGNLRYLLPTGNRAQTDITRKLEEVSEQYDAIMSDRDVIPEVMAKYGTGRLNPLLFEGSERENVIAAMENQIRNRRSPLQQGVDDAMNFLERANSLSDSPLGVRVPKKIMDLVNYSGAVRSLTDVENADERSEYIDWRQELNSEFDFFSRKMEARIKAVRNGRQKRRGLEQLAGWQGITRDLIKRGMPYAPPVADVPDPEMVDPNFVGPLQPGQQQASQPSLELSEQDQARMYQAMTNELERRKQIIVNRMIAWRQDQADAFVAQLSAAESTPAKAAIVAQLEDFDVNTQKIYERIEDARNPIDLESVLPVLREIGVRGLPQDIFQRTAAEAAARAEEEANATHYSKLIDDAVKLSNGSSLIDAEIKRELPSSHQHGYELSTDSNGRLRLERVAFAEGSAPSGLDVGAFNTRINDAVSLPEDSMNAKLDKYAALTDLVIDAAVQSYNGLQIPAATRSGEQNDRLTEAQDLIQRIKIASAPGVERDEDRIGGLRDQLMQIFHDDAIADNIQISRKSAYESMKSSQDLARGQRESLYNRITAELGFTVEDERRRERRAKSRYAEIIRENEKVADEEANRLAMVAISYPGGSTAAAYYSAMDPGGNRQERQDAATQARNAIAGNLTEAGYRLMEIHEAYTPAIDSYYPANDPWPDFAFPSVEASYATGGIVAPRPGGQLARLAEAGKSEAIVPLPDGNSIPVMFQNDSASMSGMPEPIMNSINTSVNAGMDTSSEGLMNRGGSQKVEFEISGNDRKRITDDLVAKIAAMVTRVVEQSEQRVLDDMQVRG